jgi:DNA polymerase-3 subunit epsilon
MFERRLMDLRRRRLLGQAAGALREFYRRPFAPPRSDCRTLGFVAVDLETTGLDPERDEILSIGLVDIERLRIDLAGARQYLLRPARAIPERSAVIHRITDDDAAAGATLAAVLPEVLARLAGKVLVAHHARLDVGFLDRACRRLYGAGLVLPVIDTQQLARRGLERRNQPFGAQDLRLAECRMRHNLPRYRLHNALSDALACAELLLVQLAQHDTDRPIALRYFL